MSTHIHIHPGKAKDAKSDDTISPDEDQRLKALMLKASQTMKSLKAEAYEIGGSFRGPSYWKRVQEFMK